ncbi:MAG: hypothetical protein HRT77_08970 [Halioglobus sp.]|nr:hypothetical protein [Halioglobus sp.]
MYLEDCQVVRTSVGEGDAGVAGYAVDRAAVERLWRLSEDMVGQAMTFG